jgi:hypothetical protein
VTVGRALAALLLWGGVARAQNPVVRIVDPGLGPGPQILQRAFAGPHTLVPPAAGRAVLPLDSTYRTTVIVIGREAALEGTVTGDLIVVGGDLHVHPHSTINGRAIAIGGAVYESGLAKIGSGTLSFRDFTYDVSPIPGGYELRYRSLIEQPTSAITLPGIYGFRIPSYDRTNGLSVPFIPTAAIPRTRLIVEPGVTYRSQLGEVDPSLRAKLPYSSRTTFTASVGRVTLTNDRWITPDLLNSAATFAFGEDGRNYYRATRADASISHAWEWTGTQVTPYIGARWERAESARPDSTALGGPWSIDGRTSIRDMLRPNPPIDSGTIASGVFGAQLTHDLNGIWTQLALDVEIGGFSPACCSSTSSRAFAQATLNGTITFPTFGTQSLLFEAHIVASASGDHDRVTESSSGSAQRGAPRQRWAYVGGWGSIPTLTLLERGGDELIYLDGRYSIPIDAVQLPFIGPPVITLRSVLAGADLQRWPALSQAVGARASLSVVFLEYLVDPVNRHQFFGAGISLPRQH